MDLSDVIKESAGAGHRVAIAAALVWLLVAVLKSDLVPVDFAPRARPYLALGLGQLYALLEAVVGGMSWSAAVVAGLVATVTAIGSQELGAAAKTPRPPPGAAGLLLLLAALGGAATGCGGSLQQDLQLYAEKSRDVLAAAEPCLVAQKEVATAGCKGDAACVAKVAEVYRPIADALDMIHHAWCRLSPKSEGCS